jgi:murein DD-endopeptidase MepM/ murein hydrolase activator NlpD
MIARMIKLLFFVALGIGLILAVPGWKYVLVNSSTFFEHSPPLIKVLEFPRGVGLTPVSIKLALKDDGSGLRDVRVSTTQKGRTHELLRKVLDGAHDAQVTVDFQGDKSSLEEGGASLEIKAWDKSFWSNAASTSLPLKVDYRKPRVEVLTSQHNATDGGSQVIFYKAFDENLALSGVKVGNQTFLGYPARGIDEAFTDHSLFIGIYAVDPRINAQSTSVRAFAEDEVGNVFSTSFYNHIQQRSWRETSVNISEEFLRNQSSSLADANQKKIEDHLHQVGKQIEANKDRGGDTYLIDQFKLVNEDLREINDNELLGFLEGPRFEKLWETSFSQPPGVIQSVYGEKVNFIYQGQSIGKLFRHGYEFRLTQDNKDVLATSDGIVTFAGDLGVYGRTVIIDHGLGLISLYGQLEDMAVKKGDSVTSGQPVGEAGTTGLARNLGFYFELRVHGVAVDPREWWDRQWYYAHVTSKINEIKRSLGIPVSQALE